MAFLYLQNSCFLAFTRLVRKLAKKCCFYNCYSGQYGLLESLLSENFPNSNKYKGYSESNLRLEVKNQNEKKHFYHLH